MGSPFVLCSPPQNHLYTHRKGTKTIIISDRKVANYGVATRKSSKTIEEPVVQPPIALTPEERENRLIALSYDAVEQRILNGTATAAEYVHFLKAGSLRQREEMEKLQKENALLKAKTEAIESERDKASSYREVIEALKSYRSESEDDYPNDPYVYGAYADTILP